LNNIVISLFGFYKSVLDKHFLKFGVCIKQPKLFVLLFVLGKSVGELERGNKLRLLLYIFSLCIILLVVISHPNYLILKYVRDREKSTEMKINKFDTV